MLPTVVSTMHRCCARAGAQLWQQSCKSSFAARCASSSSVSQKQHTRGLSSVTDGSSNGDIRWVFLGPPGVGKGTYASRVAKQLGVAHIATGDLIRDEIKAGSEVGKKMEALVCGGQLVPDDLILDLLQQRLARGKACGERGFILDGFPRTRPQAQAVVATLAPQLALNMALRQEVLVEKCLGRRMCRHCGKNYNIANIHLPASGGRPEIVMPPLDPPPECAQHLEQRADDTEEVVVRRLKVYQEQAAPVEAVFAEAGVLRDFEITGGIPETLPVLMQFLEPHVQAAGAVAQGAQGVKAAAAGGR